MTTVDASATNLPHTVYTSWPIVPVQRKDRAEWAAEVLIRTLHDTEDPTLYDVLRALIRPDLGALDMIDHVAALCQLSQDTADAQDQGTADAYEALADEYADALTRFVTRPVNDPMALVDAAFGRPLIDVPLPENVHAIRGER
jgi:hypothetical protein